MNALKPLIAVPITALLMALAAPALSQTVAEEFIYYPADPDEYFFFEETDRKKIVHYKTDKLVRVCVDRNEHLVPLKVLHDDNSSTVAPGDCLRFEAREVWLEPAKELEQAWTIKAEVDTMREKKAS